MQFHKDKFLAKVQEIHLKPEDIAVYNAIKDGEVRAKLDGFVDYRKNPRFSEALDEICKNLVGNTMFKLLIAKMTNNEAFKKKGKIKILEHSDSGSRYSPRDFAVKINLAFYKDNGSGVVSRQYYCINKDGKVETKLKSLAESIFHESCHALHHVSETYISGNAIFQSEWVENFWKNSEELRTITCFNHDPICDHCFDFLMSGDLFRPRYGHEGYVSGALSEQEENEKREALRLHLPLSQNFMDGWREYVI